MDYTKLIDFLPQLGEDILKIYETDFDYSSKSDDSPLTQADLLSHNVLTAFLSENYSEFGILSEESENDEDLELKEYIWVIDPLDGTKDFIQKTDEFSIMIALLNKNREPIFGAVYAPAQSRLYYAQKNEGAYLIENGQTKKLNVNSISDISEITLVRSRNHFSEFDEKVSLALGIEKFQKSGSVGVKFGLISQGAAELCYYTTDRMGIWDDCAAHVILEEAGGEVFDIRGEKPEYDIVGRKMKYGFIGTNGSISKDKILEVISQNL